MIIQKAIISKAFTDFLSQEDIFSGPVTIGQETTIRANTVQYRDWKKANGAYRKTLIVLSNDPKPIMVPVEILTFTNEFFEV